MALWSTTTKQIIYGVPPKASIRDLIKSRCRCRVHVESLFCIMELKRRRCSLQILTTSWAVFGNKCRRKSDFFEQIRLFDTEGRTTGSVESSWTKKGAKSFRLPRANTVQYVTNSKACETVGPQITKHELNKLTDESKDGPKQENKEL